MHSEQTCALSFVRACCMRACVRARPPCQGDEEARRRGPGLVMVMVMVMVRVTWSRMAKRASALAAAAAAAERISSGVWPPPYPLGPAPSSVCKGRWEGW